MENRKNLVEKECTTVFIDGESITVGCHKCVFSPLRLKISFRTDAMCKYVRCIGKDREDSKDVYFELESLDK